MIIFIPYALLQALQTNHPATAAAAAVDDIPINPCSFVDYYIETHISIVSLVAFHIN